MVTRQRCLEAYVIYPMCCGARSREFDLGWKLYGDQAGEPVYFGDKAEGKFGCYFVQDGKVRARAA